MKIKLIFKNNPYEEIIDCELNLAIIHDKLLFDEMLKYAKDIYNRDDLRAYEILE